MENKNYSTVFEADLAYLRSLGDTSECATEFEVRLKTLRKLGGDIQSTTPLLFEIEKKILDFLGGDSSLYDNIYFLRKAIAEKQGVNTEGLHTIYAIAIASLNSKPVANNYVTFTAEEANSTIGLTKLSTNQTLEYSTDATNWDAMDTTTNISLPNVGDKVYIRGILSGDNYVNNYTQFNMTGKIAASGNCNAIWNHQDLEAPLKEFCGYYMFGGCKALTTAPTLPATTLISHCYDYIFGGCTSLVEAPELPATTLAPYCYYSMFYRCTSLTTAPTLPATELADGCYYSMFNSCTSLVEAPELPATELAENCYYQMFYECTSLTTAPELPATTLTNYCYQMMFYGCKALTTAPELPATTLSMRCYYQMFTGCSSLVEAPILPVTQLAYECYYEMFYGCTALKTAPELPATTLTTGCYNGMFYGCTSLVESPILPATILASSCYYKMFKGCSNLKKITCLATNISVSSCTSDWVTGVSPTGTFIKDPNMNDWTTGNDGIPSGWNVKNLELPYVTFTAKGNNSTIGLVKLSTNQTLEYSTDTTNWNTMDTTTTITLTNKGDKAYIRGILSGDNTDTDYTQFKMTSRVAASGTCNAIWNYQNLEAPLKEYCGYFMFRNCTSLTTAPELPATSLTTRCYSFMFNGCRALTTAPELPATELAESCYREMFNDCRALTTAPELPATELAESCYTYMFDGCSNLTTAPELPATALTFGCYYKMFAYCTSLTTAPELPATTLTSHCYQQMFDNCSSLVTAPELPATTLAQSCYQQMFDNCSSLVTAPELPATTLTTYCYWNMFNGCSNLNKITCLATDISADGCTSDWVAGVSQTGTFIKNPDMTAWTSGASGIPENWTVKNYGESDGPDLTLPYVTFTAEEANSTIGLKKLSTNQTLEYSTDTTNWNTMDTTTTITLANTGDKAYIRGILSADNSGSDNTKFKMTGKIAASGNCNAIWNYQDLEAPLKWSCGYEMFRECTSLTTAPELPATKLSGTCYKGMFKDCTSLTEAPELPATTLAQGCYYEMFYNCTALKTAPELPATTLATDCYLYMFENCTSFTTAPELPATELAEGCYHSMFIGCTSLNKITCLATNISALNCTKIWLYDVSPTGTFIKNPDMNDWTTGRSGIPDGWTVEDYVG